MKPVTTFLIAIALSLTTVGSALGQTVWQVSEGTDKLDDAVFNAEAGDVIELTSNGGTYMESFSLIIDKPITIRAAEGLITKPIISSLSEDEIFLLMDDLTLEGLVLDGMNRTEVGITTDDNVRVGYSLTVNDVLFRDFKNQEGDGHAIEGDDPSQASSVTIENSMFLRIGEEAVRYKDPINAPGSVMDFTGRNLTFWQVGDEAIYVQDHDGDLATEGPNFLVENVTAHQTGSKSLYANYLEDAVIRNIVSTLPELNPDVDPFRIFGPNATAEYVLTYNTDSPSLQEGATIDSSTFLFDTDPMYLAPEIGNFRLDPESPAVGFGAGGTTLGDQRWWPETRRKIEIDGEFGDWAGIEPILVTENDPAITDTFELAAIWIAIDDEKLAFRADFFDDANINPGTQYEGTRLNPFQRWHRIYFTTIGDPDYSYRISSYPGSADTTSFTRARWERTFEDDAGEVEYENSTRFTGAIAWNKAGTSMEAYIPLDSLFVPDAGDPNFTLGPQDSLLVRFHIEAGGEGIAKNFLPALEGNKLEQGGYARVLLGDYDVNAQQQGTSVEEIAREVPDRMLLGQNYPNPFNPTTSIQYMVPEAMSVRLAVYDLLGREVAVLVDAVQNPGTWEVRFDGSSLASGTYLYRLDVGGQVMTKKMVLLK